MKKIRSKFSNPDFKFVRFKLDNIEFGVDIGSVKEMLRYDGLITLPGTPDFIEGTLTLRGMSVPVIDLRKRFFFDVPLHDLLRVMIVVIKDIGSGTRVGNGKGIVAGLIIDEIIDIAMGCKEAMIRTKSKLKRPWDGCVEAVVKAGSGKIFVIDLNLLLTRPELGALKSPVFTSKN